MARSSNEIESSLQVGRFSTQLLQQRGAQREVVAESGAVVNRFGFRDGSEVFPFPDAVNLSTALLEDGAYSVDVFYAVRGYFESRGSSVSNAEAMASITMDVSEVIGISPITLLDYNNTGSSFFPLFMNYVNRYRPNNQLQEFFKDIVNTKDSRRSRAIRA